MSSTSFRWGASAAIGLLVAVAIALLATQLVSEKIGISSEPVSAGESLAPERVEHHAKPRRHHGAGNTQVQTTSTSPPTPTADSSASSPPESGDDNRSSGGSTELESGDD